MRNDTLGWVCIRVVQIFGVRERAILLHDVERILKYHLLVWERMVERWEYVVYRLVVEEVGWEFDIVKKVLDRFFVDNNLIEFRDSHLILLMSLEFS